MFETILEVSTLISGSAVVFIGGKILLTPMGDRVQAMTYAVIFSAGVFTIGAFLLGALNL